MTPRLTACKCCLVLWLVAGTGPVAWGAGGQDAWWDEAWAYRRAVTVPPVAATRLPGDDVGYVTFFTGGLAKEDGSDVRVVAQGGREMPSRVLRVGPGDQVTVAFALRGMGNAYYAYFGNAKAGPAAGVDIRRGVLMEAWDYDGRPVKTLEQMREVLASPGKLLGRSFRPDVFLGHNPFGPGNRMAVVYTGYLVCPWSGEYVFCTSSQDASFLCVDDKLVVDNGGRHRPQRQAVQVGRITLTGGLHKLVVYHACAGRGFPIIVAAWQPPGAMQIKPIPSSAFADVAEAKAGMMEDRSGSVMADFSPEHAGEAFLAPAYLQRYSFKALSGAGASVEVEWDFGDGQTSRKASVDHVYLVEGEYAVTLTVRHGGREYRRVNRLLASRPWDLVTSKKLDGLKRYADIVGDYDFAALSDEGVGRACELFQKTDRVGDLVQAAEAALGREKPGARGLGGVLKMYAEALSRHGQAGRAGEVVLQAAQKADRPRVRAALLVSAGELFLRAYADGDKALSAFEGAIGVMGSGRESPLRRRARIGVGDVWRARGEADRARAAYREAGAASGESPVGAVVLQGDMARHVEAYLGSGDLEAAEDYLVRWAEALPEDKLGGYWSLLRVKVFLAQGRCGEAAGEAQTLVRVNPSSPYAAQLLMLAAEAYTRMTQPDRAAAVLKQIAEQYPESPLAVEAEAEILRR